MKMVENGSDEMNGNVDPAEVDALLVKELNSMSLVEREKLYEEIHGVETHVEESREFLQEKLAALEQEIQLRLAQHKADIYKEAFCRSQVYVTDITVRLRFLRAEYYNPKHAARRMMQFLEGKKKFFGENAVARPLLLTDMNEDDMECLKSGILQLLPSRDSKGRAVIADMNMNGAYKVKNIDSVVGVFTTLCVECPNCYQPRYPHSRHVSSD
jgi:hypothetical protein